MIQLHLNLNLTISARSLIVAFLIGVALFVGTDVARSAPSQADLPVTDNIVFTGPGQDGARDIRTTGNVGGMRFFNGNALTAIPDGAAIQFFGNGSTGFPGQAFIDSGAHNNAAVIIRTAGTGQGVSERMRVTATGNVGIGTTTPRSTLQVVGNYIQFPVAPANVFPPASDCDEAGDVGRVIVASPGIIIAFWVCKDISGVGAGTYAWQQVHHQSF